MREVNLKIMYVIISLRNLISKNINVKKSTKLVIYLSYLSKMFVNIY